MGRTWIRRWSPRLLAALLAATSAFALAAPEPAYAQRSRNSDEEEQSSNRVVSPEVGETLLKAQEKMQAEPPDNRGALADLDRALGTRGLSPYELGIILMLRGGVKIQLNDEAGALADWSRALAEGELNQNERLSVMYNVGQLYLAQGDYREAVTRLEEWISLGGVANDGVHLNIAAAYIELGELRNALRHARESYAKAAPNQDKKHYNTLDYLYAELNMPAERAELLSEYVEKFPQEKNVWRSIAALHMQAGRESKAFEINKIMYLNGMLTTENEIMSVVDFYSYYEVPYRGARILEREMNAGRVERNQENYEKLARLYRQANEFDLAIPALQAAARMAPNGENYRVLGEAFYAEGRLQEADNALVQAVQRGGLEKPGDTWIVIGNTRYEAEDREGAIEAFKEAERFPSSREDAAAWREFVEREIAAARNRRQFEVDVKKEEIRVSCERQLSDIVLYQTRVESGEYQGPDCIAIVRRGDFSSVPEVVEMQAAVDAEFGPKEGASSSARPAQEAVAAEDAPAEQPEDAGGATPPT